MADINIQEVTNHINIETANGYKLEFNGPVVNMNVVLSNYYTKTETDALLNDKADKADTYTKSETNILLNDKADKADTYTMSQINNMVRNIYTAVDTKQNIITGAASTITNSNLTTNRAVISNISGKVAVSNVTSTELGYLSGVTSAVQTQLNNKASTSLDNLSAAGQMIVDSQNGTISNCVLEIPQNIKVSIASNVVTLEKGSIITLTGTVYTTYTLTAAQTYTVSSSLADGKYYLFANSAGVIQAPIAMADVVSASSLPASGMYCYLTTDKIIYKYEDSEWNATTLAYPLGIIEMASGIASFAKDSNGNDMIFNGAGFVGTALFCFPNVKGLIPNGLNADGTYKSEIMISNAVRITQLASFNGDRILLSNSLGGLGVLYDLTPELGGYDAKTNLIYRGSGTVVSQQVELGKITMSSSIITDFTIRQPVRTATVEMLNSALGDVETLLAAI